MDEDMLEAAREYAGKHGFSLGEPLGSGIHGCVWMLLNEEAAAGALKIHGNAAAYRREREVYLRLRERGVREVRGLSVPELIRCDDALLALEMTIVSPPRVLDFGADHLDWPPEFSDEIWAEWRRKNEEQFGEDWPAVQAILGEFEDMGIFMFDPSPANIRFR
jgi:hypothetical protein